MIGHDDDSEEVQFKVADRRKFNSDGSVREGVTLDAAKAAPTPTPAAPEPDAAAPAPAFPDDIPPQTDELGSDMPDDELDVPGADDPASFINFLSTLATNAAASLGAVPHPATGKRTLDLETGKYWLDVLGMVREKTKGNLHPQESRLLDGILGDLRMQYVQLVRATEEKLKAQAAQKFSGADILGKK
ncbi:MAG: DUF1844 domain-containing protein [Acidobacteriota bacterium]